LITDQSSRFAKFPLQNGLQKAAAVRISEGSCRMYESIISACEVMDTLGLPRAVADFGSDRFIFANNAFLRVAGIKEEMLPSLTLSEIVKIHVGSVAWNTGQLIPISVESYDQGFIIRGHAVFSDKGLVYLMVPLFGDPSADFELGRSVGKEQERQRLSRYVYDRLVPELKSAISSLEAARRHSRDQNDQFEEEFEKVAQNLADLLQATRAELLQEPERPVTIESA
jgi:Histidine kinase